MIACSRQDADSGGHPGAIANLYLTAQPPGHQYRDFRASRGETRAHLHRLLVEKGAVPRAEQETEQKEPKVEARPEPGGVAESPESPAGQAQQIPPSPLTEKTSDAPPVQSRGEAATEPQPAARWSVLKSVLFHEAVAGSLPPQPAVEFNVAVLAVFSLAGGTGKTSLVANLGRALAAYGERVLLVDTAPFGLLPLHFGSAELRPRVVRTFAPPNGSPDAPVHAVALEPSEFPISERHDTFLEELMHDAHGSNRILIDIQTASKRTVDRLLPLSPTILIPILPDMNSVVSLHSIEAVFSGQETSRLHIEPHYLLNQFDPLVPLHVDVREILRQRLGERMLPFAIHRMSEVSEGLAEGMTVMDYAPDSAAAHDYLRLAGWLRGISPTASAQRGSRWRER